MLLGTGHARPAGSVVADGARAHRPAASLPCRARRHASSRRSPASGPHVRRGSPPPSSSAAARSTSSRASRDDRSRRGRLPRRRAARRGSRTGGVHRDRCRHPQRPARRRRGRPRHASPASRSIRARCSARWSAWRRPAACSCTTTRPATRRPATQDVALTRRLREVGRLHRNPDHRSRRDRRTLRFARSRSGWERNSDRSARQAIHTHPVVSRRAGGSSKLVDHRESSGPLTSATASRTGWPTGPNPTTTALRASTLSKWVGPACSLAVRGRRRGPRPDHRPRPGSSGAAALTSCTSSIGAGPARKRPPAIAREP